MFQIHRILVSTLVLGAVVVGLGGCGQQGPLYLPTEPAAANRATLPETLMRSGMQRPAPPAQAAPAENK
ncbi:MAG: lipoprotein [Rhodoferax sp.]|nr:lipoprotein [Rhodoferax sp.]